MVEVVEELSSVGVMGDIHIGLEIFSVGNK